MNIKSKFISIILAAGNGTRMKSKISKILHSINNKPLIYWVLKSIQIDNCKENVIVIGNQSEYVKSSITNNNIFKNFKNIKFVLQKNQLGSGDATKVAIEKINDNSAKDVLIICGDTPLIKRETVEKFYNFHKKNNSDLTILTANIKNSFGYGRIKKDKNNFIEKIIEEKNLDIYEKNIREINSGVYLFKINILRDFIFKIQKNDIANEYYLTDIVDLVYKSNSKIMSFMIEDEEEILGVNDRVSLEKADKIIRNRINKEYMIKGITIFGSDSISIDDDVKIGEDTIIYPGTFIYGDTIIGENCKIGPNTFIKDSKILNNVNVLYSFVSNAFIEDNVIIGPFSHVRPFSNIGKNSKVGNFSELKNSSLGENTKVSHLSYIGDAELGNDVNIGAGTITCNYNGNKKHKTIIGDNSFIGSNSNFIAPVIIGKNCLIGAGSTIYEDIPDNNFGIERNKQINKKRKK